eukprot:2090378-Pyramimonas_sp.AAC.1
MDTEELNEYQEIMTTVAQEVPGILERMSSNELIWTAEEARWTILGPFKENKKFYFALITGRAVFAQSDDTFTEQDIVNH